VSAGDAWPNLRAAERSIDRDNANNTGRWLTIYLAAVGSVCELASEAPYAVAVLILLGAINGAVIWEHRHRLRRAFERDRAMQRSAAEERV
jgi:hypothetical protein